MSPKVWLQYLVPQKLLTRAVYAVARWRLPAFKNAMIRTLSRIYRIDLDEAADPDPRNYPHFDAFFTRALKPGARPFDASPGTVLMPADGVVSQLGRVEDGRIVQAKGRRYGLDTLLAEASAGDAFRDGSFITVYLSPRDYHRVHTPLPGRLLRTLHVPGRLFSVAPFTVEAVPELFARNERLVCHFETEWGPMAVILVGAMLVSGVETVWGGVEIPPYARKVVVKDYTPREPPVRLATGAELGRFHMGSTVVVLLPPGFVLEPGLRPEQAVKVGQTLARRG